MNFSRPPPGDDPGTIEWTPELSAELLDPEGWAKILELYAGTMKLAVALVNAEGELVGMCHNPQPIWSLAQDARPYSAGHCLFCLETISSCSAAADALRTNSLTLVHDQAGFAHVALPLTLGDWHVGTLLAGQVLDRYPEPLPLQRVAREFGLPPQQLWESARQQAPISRANLTVYGELLWALGQTVLRDRHGAILARKLTEITKALNQQLATVNTTLNLKVDELDRSYGDLQKAQQQADSAKVYAESIVATVQESLLVLDDQFRIRSANHAFYEKFQVRAEETEGRLLYELGDGQWDIPELRRLLSELLPREQWVRDFEMEHDFVHIGSRTMVLNARRIDHVDLILLVIEDITERKRSENLLRKLNLDLKHFSYAASHDLQEPLRMVKIYTQMLSKEYKGKLDAKADQFMAFTLEGAQRLEMLLRGLREYWLVSERAWERVPIDCVQIVQKTIEYLHVPIEESGASVTYDPLPALMADEVPLAMLFQNLLGNAIKYRRPGEPPSIHISAQKKANAWCFSVKDNGVGIETEYLKEIFAPFKRLHGEDYPGSGIGLALCDKIVERYGGRLWAESTFRQGSTFYFTIPAPGGAT